MPPHVMHVGFHATEESSVDSDGQMTTAVIPMASAARLPASVAARFARIAVVDLPDTVDTGDVDDLDSYDRGIDRLRDRVHELVAEFGRPIGIVGLYEHTTLPAARLRAEFGLPGTTVRAAELCRDKVAMKQAVRDAGIAVPRFLACAPGTTTKDVERFVRDLPGRIVVKPRRQAASIGVRVLDTAADVVKLAQAGELAATDEIEEFVDGTIHHFDGVVRDGLVRWFCPSKYVNSCFDFKHADIPVASVTIDDPALTRRALDFTGTVLAALGLTDSTFHLEVFRTPDDRFVFLEIGARPGGAGIPMRTREIYGLDLARETVLACTNEPSAVPVPGTVLELSDVGASGFLIMPLPATGGGRVAAVTGADRLPASVARADIPAVGDVLDADALWPTAGFFLLRGASTAAVEQDMTTITQIYEVTIALGETG